MKIIILAAILFFSWRVFAAEDYYYEGRYYKIEEYIRFQEDPNYIAYLNEKKAEERRKRQGIDQYFAQREKEAYQQEQSRLQHLAELERRPQEQDIQKLEAQYEKERLAEERRQAQAALEYLAQRGREMELKRPSRMIASVFETPEDVPLKRVPRDKRKFIPKKSKGMLKSQSRR